MPRPCRRGAGCIPRSSPARTSSASTSTRWSPEVGAAIAQVNHEISTLAPALVEPGIAASTSLGSTIKVGARDHNGAVYVIAVNASRTPATTTITVPALADRTLVTLDAQHKVKASGGSFTTTFAPLEERI